MADYSYIIETKSLPVLPVAKRGRKVGNGFNIKLLSKMEPGQSVWDVPLEKMQSIRATAFKHGIKITVRKMPNSPYYAIWRK